MAGKNVTIKIDSDTKGAESGINKISKELNSFANNVKKGPLDNAAKLGAAVTGVGTAFSAVTGAIKAASAAIHECTEAYNIQAKAERQLEVAAKNNPYLNNTNVTNLKNYAAQLQELTTYGDEQLLPMMAELAASGRTEEQIMQVMGAAVDVAASGTMSLDAAVSALNKTYSGTAGTLGKTNAQIKALTEDELKNGDAVKIMAEQYKGMAEETTKATGSTEQLKNAWGDFKEHIGSGFEALLAPIRRGITEIISGVNNSISRMKQARIEAKIDEQVISGDIGRLDSGETEASSRRLSEKLQDAERRYGDIRAQAESAYKAAGYTEIQIRKALANLTSENDVWGYLDARQAYNEARDAYTSSVNAVATTIKREAANRAEEAKAERARAVQDEQNAMQQAVNAVEKSLNAARTVTGKDAMTDANMTSDEKKAMYDAIFNALKNGLESSADATALENSETYKQLTERLKKYVTYETKTTTASKGKEEKTAAQLVAELMQSVDQIFRDAENNQDITGEVMDLEKVWQKQSDTIVNGVVDILSKYQDLKFSDEIFDQVADKLTDIGNQLDMKASEEDRKARYDDLMAKLGDAIGEKSLPLSKELKQRKEDLKKFAEETMELYAEGSDERIAIEEKTAEALKAIDKDITQAKREEWDERLSIAQDYMNRFTEISNYLVDLTLKANEAESKARLAALEDEYDQGLVSETEFEEKRDQIQKEAAQESYKMELWQWGVQVAQIGVDTAKAIMSAISTSGNIYAGIAMATLVGAMGAAQLGAAIANKPKAPSFEAGGIVPGTSWSGDNVQANVNSGEMVLTRGQQARLWNMLGGGGSSGTQVSINNYLGRIARIQTQSNKNGLTIDVLDSHINKTMADGGYDTGFAGRDVARQGVVLV